MPNSSFFCVFFVTKIDFSQQEETILMKGDTDGSSFFLLHLSIGALLAESLYPFAQIVSFSIKWAIFLENNKIKINEGRRRLMCVTTGVFLFLFLKLQKTGFTVLSLNLPRTMRNVFSTF